MNEFVSNTADIQEEFKRSFFILKNENIRLNDQNESLTLRIKEQGITIAALGREAEGLHVLQENLRILQESSSQAKSENARLMKEIYYYQEVERNLYEGATSIETERQDL